MLCVCLGNSWKGIGKCVKRIFWGKSPAWPSHLQLALVTLRPADPVCHARCNICCCSGMADWISWSRTGVSNLWLRAIGSSLLSWGEGGWTSPAVGLLAVFPQGGNLVARERQVTGRSSGVGSSQVPVLVSWDLSWIIQAHCWEVLMTAALEYFGKGGRERKSWFLILHNTLKSGISLSKEEGVLVIALLVYEHRTLPA